MRFWTPLEQCRFVENRLPVRAPCTFATSASQYTVSGPWWRPAYELDRLDWLGPYLPTQPDYVLTTNLDDDDALPDNFISTAHNAI